MRNSKKHAFSFILSIFFAIDDLYQTSQCIMKTRYSHEIKTFSKEKRKACVVNEKVELLK